MKVTKVAKGCQGVKANIAGTSHPHVHGFWDPWKTPNVKQDLWSPTGMVGIGTTWSFHVISTHLLSFDKVFLWGLDMLKEHGACTDRPIWAWLMVSGSVHHCGSVSEVLGKGNMCTTIFNTFQHA